MEPARHPFPVSSTAPHYRRIKNESQDHSADMGVTHFERNFSSALRSPSLAQSCHRNKGGNQNHPPSASPTLCAVPWAAKAAVNRQIRAARRSWSISALNLRQTSPGKSNSFESVDPSLPVSTARL